MIFCCAEQDWKLQEHLLTAVSFRDCTSVGSHVVNEGFCALYVGGRRLCQTIHMPDLQPRREGDDVESVTTENTMLLDTTPWQIQRDYGLHSQDKRRLGLSLQFSFLTRFHVWNAKMQFSDQESLWDQPVISSQVTEDGAHGVLGLLQLCASHGSTAVQNEQNVLGYWS